MALSSYYYWLLHLHGLRSTFFMLPAFGQRLESHLRDMAMPANGQTLCLCLLVSQVKSYAAFCGNSMHNSSFRSESESESESETESNSMSARCLAKWQVVIVTIYGIRTADEQGRVGSPIRGISIDFPSCCCCCVFYLPLLIHHTSIIMLRNGNHKSQQSSTLAMTRLLQPAGSG